MTLNLDKTLSGGGTENKDQRNKWTVDKTTTTEAGTRHAGTMEKREGKRKSSLRWASKVKSMAVVVVICIEGQHIERVSEDVSYLRTQATTDDDDGGGQIKELQTKHSHRQI